jgi:hypothetical protein
MTACYMTTLLKKQQNFQNCATRTQTSDSTSTTLCAATTHLPVAWVLHQLRRAPQLLVSRLLYLNLVMRRRAARPIVGQSHWLTVTTSRGPTTRRPDCTGSTAPMPCIRARCFDARPLVGQSHWLSLCARSLRLAAATDILRLRRASGCLGTSRGSSRGSSCRPSSTTSTTSHVRVPRHVAWLVTRLVAPLVVNYSASRRLVVDYIASAARPGASARHATRHAAHRQLLRAPRLPLAATLALLQPRRASRLLVSRQHWLYFEYATCHRRGVFRSYRVDLSSRLVFQTSRERWSRPQQLVGINSD